MLPKDHEIVTAGVWGISAFLINDGNLPFTVINFNDSSKKLSVEDVLNQVEAYPKNVFITGNPLHQNQEFLRLVVMDLVNKDHLVTINDTSDRPIIWNLVQPNVRFWIDVPVGARVQSNNFRKLDHDDVVSFVVNNKEQYRQAKQRIKLAKQTWNTKVTFNLDSSIPDITKWVLEDRLEVRVNSPQVV